MYFQIQEGSSPIPLQKIDEDKLTLGIISLKELEKCYEHFGFSYSTVVECKNDRKQIHSAIDVYDNYHFGIIIGINTRHILREQDRIGIYIKKNLFLIVVIEDEDDSIRAKLLESLKNSNLSKVTIEKLIYGFLERLIIDEYTTLEKIEAEISEHEDKISGGELIKNFTNDVIKLRKRLVLLDNYYEQLIGIGEELEENGLDLFEDHNLRYFKLFTDRVTRLSSNTRMLQEYTVHVREAYHAELDYDLNKTMKIFTVISMVFYPLTLIVGWYGMNFTTIPELTWKYGYLYVIILSIIVAILCVLYFRRKKFL